MDGSSMLFSSLAATKYTTVASAVLLVWDMTLTLDLEVSRVWMAKKTLGTTVFFINRYFPPLLFSFDLYSQFIVSPSISFCKNYELSSSILDLVSIAVIESVLVMRTHALYRNNLLLAFLSFLCIASMAVMLTCFLIVFKYETFVSASLIGLTGCLSGCTSSLCQPILIAFWVPFFLFETIVFCLTIWMSYQHYKLAETAGLSTVIKVIARDGIIYYLVIISISICNFLIWILDPFASYLAVGLLKSLQATICSRLLLNLRGILETRRELPQESAIEFSDAAIYLEDLGPRTDLTQSNDLTTPDVEQGKDHILGDKTDLDQDGLN